MADGWAETIKTIIVDATLAATGLDKAVKVANGIKDLLKSEKFPRSGEAREQLVDLTEQLLTVREQKAALRKSLLEVHEALSQRDKFEAEADNYVLKETAPNSLTFVAKSPRDDAEKAVRLCAHCFGEKRKSLLQFEKSDWHFNTLVCQSCGSRVREPNGNAPTVMVGPVSKRALW